MLPACGFMDIEYPFHSRSPQCWGWIAGGNDLMVGCRSYGNGLLGEAMEEQSAGLGTSAIEAEGEFVEVVVEMLVLDAALMGSHQPSLEQRRNVMNAGHDHVGRMTTWAGSNPPLMTVT